MDDPGGSEMECLSDRLPHPQALLPESWRGPGLCVHLVHPARQMGGERGFKVSCHSTDRSFSGSLIFIHGQFHAKRP